MDESLGIDNVTLRLLESRPPIVKETEERLSIIRRERPADIANLLTHDVKNVLSKQRMVTELAGYSLSQVDDTLNLHAKIEALFNRFDSLWSNTLQNLPQLVEQLPHLILELKKIMVTMKVHPKFSSLRVTSPEVAELFDQYFASILSFKRVLPIFLDEMRFLDKPSEQAYQKMAAHRVPLQEVIKLVTGKVPQNTPEIEIHGGEAVALFNALFNAQTHRTKGTDVHVSLVDNTVVITNRSNNSLKDKSEIDMQEVFHIHPKNLQPKVPGGDRIHWGLVIAAYMSGLQGGQVTADEHDTTDVNKTKEITLCFNFNRPLVPGI